MNAAVDPYADTVPAPPPPPVHVCHADGRVRQWDELEPGWDEDDYGLAGATCPVCHSTLCKPARARAGS